MGYMRIITMPEEKGSDMATKIRLQPPVWVPASPRMDSAEPGSGYQEPST